MAIEFYERYLMTGGMPEVVAADAAGAQDFPRLGDHKRAATVFS